MKFEKQSDASRYSITTESPPCVKQGHWYAGVGDEFSAPANRGIDSGISMSSPCLSGGAIWTMC